MREDQCLLMPPSPSPLITPVFWRRNHRLPSCSFSLFFQTLMRIHLLFQHVSHYPKKKKEKKTARSNTLQLICPFNKQKKNTFRLTLLIYSSPVFVNLPVLLTDSLWFAAGSQSAAAGHPLLEQPEPRRPHQPRPAAGPQLPLPGETLTQVCVWWGRGVESRREGLQKINN